MSSSPGADRVSWTRRRIKNIPTEIFYFQLTSGGTAPFGQIGLVTLMAPHLVSPDDNQVRVYAENVADMLLNGLSLPDVSWRGVERDPD
jgi:hypothetical protein